MRLALSFVLTVALAVAALGVGNAQATPPGAEYAVNVQTLIRGGSGGSFPHESWPVFLGRAAQEGVHAARFEAMWSWAESGKPQGAHTYDWSRQDDAVAALARAGMRWKAVLSFLPGWAHGPNGVGFPAQYHDDFAAFAAAVAQRYGPGGAFWAAHPELPFLPVAEYEVWSEPNSFNYWQPTPDPVEYGDVYRQVRAAIKGVDGGAEVLVSLGWQDFAGFLRRMHDAAGGAWAIDGVAFHPYAPTPLGVVSLVRQLRATLIETGTPAVPIHVWEIGWPRQPQGPGAAHSWDGRITDEARGVNTALTSDALLRSDCRVPDVAVYSIVEKEADPGAPEQWFGLLHPDGSITATMQTWSASIARLRAETPLRHLALCDASRTAPTTSPPLLRLVLAASVFSPGCVSTVATYHGHPLEEVSVAYRTAHDAQGGANTDTSGRADFCVPASERTAAFTITASMPRLAASPTLRCTRSGCAVAPSTRAATACARPRVLAPRRARPVRGVIRIAVGLACAERMLSGRRLRVYGISPTARRHVLRTVRTRSRRVRILVRVNRRYSSALVVSFQGVRRLGMGPARLRVALG